MAEEKKTSAAKEFFSKYGEKLGLGLAVLALLAYAVVAFGMSKPDPSVAQIEKEIVRIKKEQSFTHPEMKAPEVRNWQADAVGNWGEVIQTPRGADGYAASLRTEVKEKTTDIVIKKAKVALLPAVSFLGADVAIDCVTVNWTFTDFTKEEKTKAAKEDKELAAITHFTLERQANGGKWEELEKSIDAKTLTYKDVKIEPKQKYAYRITAYSTDKAWLERGGTPDPTYGGQPNPGGKGNTAVGPQIPTMGLWNLVFKNPSKPENADKGMAYVKIEKFEKGHGKIETAHIHYEGDKIGWWPEGSGGPPVSVHRLSLPGGKSIEADLNTGATLVKVEPVKLVVDVKRCKPIFTSSGQTGCNQTVEKRNFDTYLIQYKDDEGIHKIHSPSPGDLNQLCPEHGGRRVGPPPGAPGAPGVPGMTPAEAAKAKREGDAEKLFQDADKTETTNKTKAGELFAKLLKDFADTDFVTQRKRLIEDRIAIIKGPPTPPPPK